MTPTQDDPNRPTDGLGNREPVEVGRYRLLGPLGAGGMGSVYKAHDPQLDRVVALKLPHFDGPMHMRAAREQRFYREARAAAAVRHPHVCPIYDVGEHEGRPYVVMAYIEGETLAKRLSNQTSAQSAQRVITLVQQVLDALDTIHAHGIIHRDLKPANILLDADGSALVADFGLARSLAESEALTSEGVVLGTPWYMAPEQALGRVHDVGPWTDLYAVGVILFQLITGRLPFEGQAVAVLARIAHENPPPPSRFRPGLNPVLETIILKALAREPRNRYQSAREFGEALSRLGATFDLSTMTYESLRPNSQAEPSSATLPGSGHSAIQPAPERLSTLERSHVGRLANLLRAVKEMSLRRKLLAVVLLLIGIVSVTSFYRSDSSHNPGGNPFVTRENYIKIRPDMFAWEVDAILGSGTLNWWEDYIVDDAGNITKNTQFNTWSGTLNDVEGKPVRGKGSRKITREFVWRNGQKAIFVWFENDKVVSKKEQGLYRQ